MNTTQVTTQIERFQSVIGGEQHWCSSAKELHSKMDVEVEFPLWIAQHTNNNFFHEGTDYVVQASGDYFITTRMGMHLIMLDNHSDLSHKMRDYFLECEKTMGVAHELKNVLGDLIKA
ncbi:hypothetical protein GCM10007938_26770 [Vibrio zhanjiangensis]|uniref:AntA/AntB antirepressor domain-containing protein n=1 Tax=Vibrio zhanjiangensis TaxID=1046128 RepID=A0ABQ6F063_9VIBR|nr:antA/AntB antirepressor family protein [Vibrio zhanjiangensis]GLT18895.1 hypothetical protein GCM10007938_26770 [Vibrio zhanjiangensis]